MTKKVRINANIFKEDAAYMKQKDFPFSFIVSEGVKAIENRKKSNIEIEENKRAIEKVNRRIEVLLNRVSILELETRKDDTTL